MFDPFVLKKLHVDALKLLVHQLVHSEKARGDLVFSLQFLRLMKKELPKAKEHAAKEFDWDSIPNCTK